MVEHAFDAFSDEDRRTLILATLYDRIRGERTRADYQVFGCSLADLDKAILANPVYRQLSTVRKWLEEDKGFAISWDNLAWQGYIRFVFDRHAPKVPMPGQLKNAIYLKQFLGGTGVAEDLDAEPQRTPKEMGEIYGDVLLPWIAKDQGLMKALGLRDLDRLEGKES